MGNLQKKRRKEEQKRCLWEINRKRGAKLKKSRK